MSRLVMKFGGTSVGDVDRIARVARLVASERKPGLGLAVVGSAMAVVYFVMLKVLRVHELDDVVAPLLSRVRSRMPSQG
jgi:aspartokinase